MNVTRRNSRNYGCRKSVVAMTSTSPTLPPRCPSPQINPVVLRLLLESCLSFVDTLFVKEEAGIAHCVQFCPAGVVDLELSLNLHVRF
ncbi:hypothetical protein Btru_014428 [Bulinus truncatus]|nr:hypothetical protein Btru_014428 [Bulinus truncatus]